jgi:hypothetical protein
VGDVDLLHFRQSASDGGYFGEAPGHQMVAAARRVGTGGARSFVVLVSMGNGAAKYPATNSAAQPLHPPVARAQRQLLPTYTVA